MSYYTINIAKADQNKDGSIKIGYNKQPSYSHYFATASRSIGLSSSKAKQLVKELSQIYPMPLYKIEVSLYNASSSQVDIKDL